MLITDLEGCHPLVSLSNAHYLLQQKTALEVLRKASIPWQMSIWHSLTSHIEGRMRLVPVHTPTLRLRPLPPRRHLHLRLTCPQLHQDQLD